MKARSFGWFWLLAGKYRNKPGLVGRWDARTASLTRETEAVMRRFHDALISCVSATDASRKPWAMSKANERPPRAFSSLLHPKTDDKRERRDLKPNRRSMMSKTAASDRCTTVKQSIGQVALVVREYEEAIDFFVGALGFTLVEDSHIRDQDKRWVVVAPPGSPDSRLLLARAVGEEQSSRIGNQTGGRVFLFLYTDDFWRDYHAYKTKGVVFVRAPKVERYGTVAVFEDLYGNLWDLLQSSADVHDQGDHEAT